MGERLACDFGAAFLAAGFGAGFVTSFAAGPRFREFAALFKGFLCTAPPAVLLGDLLGFLPANFLRAGDFLAVALRDVLRDFMMTSINPYRKNSNKL